MTDDGDVYANSNTDRQNDEDNFVLMSNVLSHDAFSLRIPISPFLTPSLCIAAQARHGGHDTQHAGGATRVYQGNPCRGELWLASDTARRVKS